MNDRESTTSAGAPTRRQVITGAAFTIGALASGSAVFGRSEPPMVETQSTGPDRKKTFLHQEVSFKATPQRIFAILLDSKQFSAFSGEPAEISREAGGAFSMFGGKIVGRNIEVDPSAIIVQAWRPASWDLAVYSIVKFVLVQSGSQTKVILDHTGFPEGDFGHLNTGWGIRYWKPLAKYLG